MTKTLANEKQAEAIKRRMREIRTELPYDVDNARHQVQQLTDWRYYVRRFPVLTLATTAAVAYALVPRRKDASPSGTHHVATARNHHEPSSQSPNVPKKSILGGMAGAVGAIAMRQATRFAASKLESAFLGRSSGGARK
ncbi:hypothetical protein [Crateriforma conspicua]|uniref:DUF3618 domain-containing protein n=1 Tax=Crateriforma conspicua TaxID=2527996 RepID=A0A5C5Y150_9PLAN|nr:hypothetical protein [Crateriforma conspicua]TWT68944.1 hypothetical protein Pan14r_12280 [Crateriforma conspicua]